MRADVLAREGAAARADFFVLCNARYLAGAFGAPWDAAGAGGEGE